MGGSEDQRNWIREAGRETSIEMQVSGIKVIEECGRFKRASVRGNARFRLEALLEASAFWDQLLESRAIPLFLHENLLS